MKDSKIEEAVSVSYLRSLFEEMQKYDISDLTIKNREQSFEISRRKDDASSIIQNPPLQKPSHQPQNQPNTSEKAQLVPEKMSQDDNLYEIKTPIVGTFYRSPSPDEEPFVEVGSEVKKDQTLCIVEAMKAMNEIQSEVGGIVEEILIEDANMVEFDQPLFKIRLAD